MRECWYCKYSDFRKNISELWNRSVCRLRVKRSDEEEIERKKKEFGVKAYLVFIGIQSEIYAIPFNRFNQKEIIPDKSY